MSPPAPCVPRPIRPAARLALVPAPMLLLALALAGGAGPAASARDGVQWQLEASVPVICAILGVDRAADRPNGLAITTSCNAERYQLVVNRGSGQVRLRAASSSAGPVQISGSAVTITSTRPGYALTTVELTAPASPDTLSITIQPV